MGKRYLVEMPVPAAADLDGDGRVTVGELVASTLILGSLVALGLAVIVGGLWLIFQDVPGWARVVTLIAVLAALITCGIGAWRMLRYERGERLTVEEIQRRRKFEDDDRALRSGLQQADTQARISQADVDAAVWDILKAYFAGREWARGKIDGISEPRWNLANEALQKSKLRKGRKTTLEAETLDLAWAMYLEWRGKTRSHYVTSEGGLIAK